MGSMDKSVRETGVARDGSRSSQAEPEQAELFAPPRLTFRQFFRRLLRGDYKTAGVRIFGGDPESARVGLSRILEGKPGRYADWEWIDLILEVLGPEAARDFVHFVADRYGFERPNRLPDVEATREELERVKDTLAETTKTLTALTGAIERLEKR